MVTTLEIRLAREYPSHNERTAKLLFQRGVRELTMANETAQSEKNLRAQAIKICSVEDDESEFAILKAMLDRYFLANDRDYFLDHFEDGGSFLETNTDKYDLVLMDIELKNSNGMSVAEELRKTNQDTVIIFVTKMAQFAVKGYQVNALDFLVKPYTYEELAFRLNRALDVISKKDHVIMVKTKSGLQVIRTADLWYVDVYGHSLGFHTEKGTWYAWGKLGDYDGKLSPYGFLRCSNSALVNARFIKAIQGMAITMENGDVITISHPRRKSFMEALAGWAGYEAL